MISSRAVLAGILAVCGSGLALLGCSSQQDGEPDPTTTTAEATGECPTAPLDVVVSVDQWGSVVDALGGDCANVTTVLAASSVDPHDFEPSPAQAAQFTDAQLIVVNGADFDHWATDLAASTAPQTPVVDAAEVTVTPGDANPHLWYSPAAVDAVADAVTAELSRLAPPAADYFATRRAGFSDTLVPYTAEIDAIRSGAAGKTYVATENVFEYMAEALGLENKTPLGYQTAAANESEPSPADLAAFRAVLADGEADVLIYNSQTEGSIPQQLREAATEAGVPVVEVTETVAPGADSFVSWQVPQLDEVAKALGVGT